MDMLHNNNERLIRLRDIDKRYHHAGQELSILRGVSLEVARGESCAILGSEEASMAAASALGAKSHSRAVPYSA